MFSSNSTPQNDHDYIMLTFYIDHVDYLTDINLKVLVNYLPPKLTVTVSVIQQVFMTYLS